METNITNISPGSPAVKLNSHDTRKLYEFLVKYKFEHDGNSPSNKDIRTHCRISSSSVVIFHLRKLAKKGLISLDDYPKPRSIKIVGAKWLPPENVDFAEGQL